MNEVSNSESDRDRRETIRSWGNHFFDKHLGIVIKGVFWLLGIIILSLGSSNLSEIISIQIDWTIPG